MYSGLTIIEDSRDIALASTLTSLLYLNYSIYNSTLVELDIMEGKTGT